MSALSRRRPSPAMVVAATALFVSLGGVSYGVATGSIDSREIKNNAVGSRDVRNNSLRGVDVGRDSLGSADVARLSGRDVRDDSLDGADIARLTGRDVRDDSLDGADVDERRLGKVASATHADSADTASRASRAGSAASADTATRASNAGALNGRQIAAINLRARSPASGLALDFHGLRIFVACAGTDGAVGAEAITLRSTVPGSEVAVMSTDTDPEIGGSARYAIDDDFGPGDALAVSGTVSPQSASDRIYQVVYTAGNSGGVTATFATEDDIGADDCIVNGHAIG